MKYLFALVTALLIGGLFMLTGCSPDREVVQILKGDPGQDGADGTSCTVQQAEGGAMLSCSDGSEAFIANGLPGPQGPQGIPGSDGEDGEDGEDGSDCDSATLRDYSGSSCQNIVGTSKYVKKNGSNFKLYSSSSCHSFTAFAEVSEGESYWVSSDSLAVHADEKLRVITFGDN